LLILTYEFPPLGGGAGNAAAELVRALGDIPGMSVVVVTSSTGDFYVDDKSFSPNSTIYYLPIGKTGGNIHYQTNFELLRYNFACHRFLRKLLVTESFDFCHASMTVPAGINAWLHRKKIPYLISLQGSDVPWYSDRFKFAYYLLSPIIKRIWRDSAAVVSNSVALRDLALQSAPEQAIDVITNGIDRKLFRPGSHKSKDDKARIICVGRLIERKGVWELLEAMPAVLKDVPNAHLELVGTGDLEGELAERIQSSGLGEHITLCGAVAHDELPVLLRRASLFALPSHAEGMSNALLEGIACGLPIVVTHTGGTSELLRDNGIVVPMRDPVALAAAIVEILGNEEKLLAMGRASLRVAERYSWGRMTEEYLGIYRDHRDDEICSEVRGKSRTDEAQKRGSLHL
jgi:glycosyltransferase involved in cell wall biosynthesis